MSKRVKTNTGYMPNIYSSDDDDNDDYQLKIRKIISDEEKDEPVKTYHKKQKFNFIQNDKKDYNDKKNYNDSDDSLDDFIVEDDFVEYQDGSVKKAGVLYNGSEFYEKIDKIIDQEREKQKQKRTETYLEQGEKDHEEKLLNLKVLTEKIANTTNKRNNKIHEDQLDENILKKYSPDERKRMKKEYEDIKKYISSVPTVFDILETNSSFKEKCMLMQQLDILINLDPYSHEYISKRNHMTEQIEKMKKQEKSEYDDLEKELLEIVDQNESLKYRILKSGLKKEQKAIVYGKYVKLQKMEPTNSEYHKLKEWIEQALNVPTENKKINLPILEDGNDVINEKLCQVLKLLDSKLYGMNNVKEEILLLLNNKITNHDNTGNALALLGPPGTGKTCIIRTLSQALNIPFVQISLGGTTDSAYLDGHGYTYEGATPGMIAKAVMQMKCNNGIIFFDEIDKLSESDKGKEVAWNLLHITDFSQNNDFRDKYLCDIPIDLSKIWFIYSMNDDSFMDKALRDRMPIIKVSGYKKSEKVIISKEYIIPRIMKNINMDQNAVNFDDKVLEYIVSLANENTSKYDDFKNNDYNQTGVRELEKMLGRILSRINLYKNTVLDKDGTGGLRLTFTIKDFKVPFSPTNETIDELLKNYKKSKPKKTGMYN